MEKQIERQLAELVAAERLYVPVSSIDGKLKRKRPVLASNIDIPVEGYIGQRFYARVEREDVTAKARTMTQAGDLFAQRYPRSGEVLKGLIAETRLSKETNLYFGMNPGCRLTADDYLGVMTSLGFTETQAQRLYEPLVESSRQISRARNDGERSILVG